MRTGRPASTGGRVAALAVIASLALAGCGVTRGEASRDIDMIIPNSPGGGYDVTGRAAAADMEAIDATGGTFAVTNVIGAGGSVAFSSLMNRKGDERVLMTMGLGVVGSLYSFGSEHKVTDATPIAQLIEDSEGIIVPADSPFKTIDDLITAWKADPGSIVVGGGSSPGGPDHLFPMQLAKTVGIDPRQVRYVVYDGGGPLTTALLGGKIQVGFSGLGEFEGQLESGELRALAASGDARGQGEVLGRVPTLTEEGIDLVFTNWRGVLAPPGISEARRQELIGYVEAMHASPQWKATLKKQGWTDELKTGDEFGAFLDEQQTRVGDTLSDLGLIDE